MKTKRLKFMEVFVLLLIISITITGCDLFLDNDDNEETVRNVPYDLRIEEIAGEEHLVWDWDGSDEAKFVIIRSATDDLDDGYVITDEALEDTQYPLSELDTDHYYWIRAYVGGYSSGLDDPLYLE